MKKDIRKGYIERRRRAYPSVEDQLDQLYHGGLEAWRATIKEIKNAHPKPPISSERREKPNEGIGE